MDNLKDQKEKKTDEAPKKSKEGAKGLINSFKKLDTKKKIQYVAILLIAIIILTIYFSSFKGSGAKDNKDNAEPKATATEIKTKDSDDTEKKLEDTLSKIEGAGKVKVMITYESSPEIVPAYSVDKQTSSTKNNDDKGSSSVNSEDTQSDVVTINGNSGNSALVLREESPEVKGIIVIAEGADNIEVKLNLLKAVQTVLNVSPDKVDVYKMNNE